VFITEQPPEAQEEPLLLVHLFLQVAEAVAQQQAQMQVEPHQIVHQVHIQFIAQANQDFTLQQDTKAAVSALREGWGEVLDMGQEALVVQSMEPQEAWVLGMVLAAAALGAITRMAVLEQQG
jgi:hypothetical protein